jgi:hypothetical protein
MEVRIQNLTVSSQLQASGGSNYRAPQLPWRPCYQQGNRLVQLPKTGMIWINSLVQPLVVIAGNNSGPYSVEISTYATL